MSPLHQWWDHKYHLTLTLFVCLFKLVLETEVSNSNFQAPYCLSHHSSPSVCLAAGKRLTRMFDKEALGVEDTGFLYRSYFSPLSVFGLCTWCVLVYSEPHRHSLGTLDLLTDACHHAWNGFLPLSQHKHYLSRMILTSEGVEWRN